MKICNDCHVELENKLEFCPLCGTTLEDTDKRGLMPYVLNRYPDFSKALHGQQFIKKLFVFISLLGAVVSVLVNFFVAPKPMWSLLVLGGLAYGWLIIPPILRRGTNKASQVVMQVLLTSILLIGVDFFFGYRGWSVNYVVPSLFIAGMLTLALFIVFNRTNWRQYLIYQFIMALFSLVPLVLFLFGISTSLVMALVAASLGFASIFATVVFGDRSVKNEFRRRFHF